MFINNKYSKWYYNIINAAKSRVPFGYTEKHHIIPECFFKNSKRGKTVGDVDGNPDNIENLVKLTAREHFVCHLLLPKMVKGNKKRQMVFALWSMTNRSRASIEDIYWCNSRTYSNIKEQFSKDMSILHTGRIITKETREKMSKARIGSKASADTKKKISKSSTGRLHSEKTKSYMSTKLKEDYASGVRIPGMTGKSHSKETKEKISKGNNGKTMPKLSQARKDAVSKQFLGSIQSDTHKQRRITSRQKNGYYKDRNATLKRMSDAAKNKPKLKCHCGKECSPPNFKRWHGDNCKL